MARLSLSTFIPATPEEVYEHVTAFAEGGPVDAKDFREKYGEILSRDDNVFLTQEVDGDKSSARANRITWRCTFQYPSRREMEALDSRWSDRVDIFRPAKGGTRWTIRWSTRVKGVLGLAQILMFRLAGHKNARRFIVAPVRGHFERGN